MNDQQQSRADALMEAVTHTIETIKRQLDLIADRAPSNFLDKRSVVQSLTAHVRRLEKALAASPVEQPALLTAQDALAAIETFEIVGDNNDSREPNAEDRFILTEFVAHLFGGFRVELPAAAPASANETGAEGPAIELLRKFMEYRDSDYVPNMLFDCARTIIDNAMAAAALADETPEGCTPADARMLREANHALAAENDALRRTLRPFARVVSTDKLSWAMVEYCVEGDPEKQTFQAPQMQRAFNRAADILRAESSQPAAAPADERAECIAWANANGFPKYHESMCAAWEERARRAAASPAAEAVATVEVGSMEHGPFTFQTTPSGADTLPKGVHSLYAAPQPAQADAPAEAREPIAWMTDDDRAITAAQKQRALADGGATASSVRPYSIPCYAVSAPADAGEARLTDAARDMLAERRRQVEAEGWTPEHDDQYQHGAIALAAACYAANAGGVAWADPLPSFWPWMHNWWKPTTPRRDLVKAGALILAELERLDRAALLNGADHDR